MISAIREYCIYNNELIYNNMNILQKAIYFILVPL